ncbi:hypothetical protein ACIG0C_14925 [Kitasatospora aureofaciens]|uniref:PE-PGRS family protein n=1 Tax=Kitasatospora aureofaciens TaxID=1894 RepID=A0A1E7NAC6_KITAU|nr:hypothetical protein [Kitasatospora aureofaciens]ARF79896.1 hypothetical protein B6264_14170 [Kitasatospora aureofaciens]OEV37639.1 hypothetical protein HS99_0025385 [Kitasatospora aureofaciens]GGU90876.1 hypothetical protein GCM10010502_50050 [Kitasatospora aureofaciens]
MSAPHRPDFPAGDLVDPVLTVHPLGRALGLPKRPNARADSALVLTTPSGEHQVYLPPHRPGFSDLVGRGYQAAFEVDLGLHHLRIEERLPGRDDIGAFEAMVEIDWQVSAAELVVASRIRDVPALLTPRIRQRMRAVTRNLTTDQSGEAETAVQQALDEYPVAEAEGLRVRCAVQLDIDQAARDQKERLRGYHFDTQAHPHALRQVEESHEILAAKAKFYQYHLEQGGVAAWALQVAAHPEDLKEALKYLKDEQRELVQGQLHVIERLLGQNALEEFELEGPRQDAKAALEALLRQRPAGPASPGPGAPRLDKGPNPPLNR